MGLVPVHIGQSLKQRKEIHITEAGATLVPVVRVEVDRPITVLPDDVGDRIRTAALLPHGLHIQDEAHVRVPDPLDEFDDVGEAREEVGLLARQLLHRDKHGERADLIHHPLVDRDGGVHSAGVAGRVVAQRALKRRPMNHHATTQLVRQSSEGRDVVHGVRHRAGIIVGEVYSPSFCEEPVQTGELAPHLGENRSVLIGRLVVADERRDRLERMVAPVADLRGHRPEGLDVGQPTRSRIEQVVEAFDTEGVLQHVCFSARGTRKNGVSPTIKTTEL